MLAARPRAAGGPAEAAARQYAAGVLRGAGFDVADHAFEYSAFPGRLGTPAGALIALLGTLGSFTLAMSHHPRWAALVLAAGIGLLTAYARRLLGDGVLTLPWLRAGGTNLVATRGASEPRVWLVAHLDTKSQPVPSAARVAGVVLLALGVMLALIAVGLQLGGLPHRTLWWVAAGLALAGALPVATSVVGDDSDGAVDNASGAAAVLTAAQTMAPGASVGVLLPSAEELGMAGARAWVRARVGAAGVAINCDGVDDDGELYIMYSGQKPLALIDALRACAPREARVRRLPLGLLTDSVAFHDAGWPSVTVSRGSFATLRRVHTRRDSLVNLRGDGIAEVAGVLRRAAEALAP